MDSEILSICVVYMYMYVSIYKIFQKLCKFKNRAIAGKT